MAKHCQHAGPKRSIGRVKVPGSKKSYVMHKCSPKTKAQKKIAAAGRACAGTGKIGGASRTKCLRDFFRKGR
jgi:hypothetical protein